MFQVLDTKGECVGFYKNGELIYNLLIEELDKTWGYSPILRGKDVEYAQIYANGKTLEECCPPEMREEWDRVNSKLKTFVYSFMQAKISLNENCLFDLVPERYLKEYYDAKSKITEHVFATYEKPAEYNFYRQFSELIGDIRARELQLNRGWLSEKLWDVQGKKLWEKIIRGHTKIDYNMFGSITGRLTVTEDSFPILNLNKNLRSVIEPTNNWFVELDMNAAELRTAMALMNKKQIEGDLHEWSINAIFGGRVNRGTAKETATSWLYNSKSKLAVQYDAELSKFYNKEALKAMFWVDGIVNTPFKRRIEADEHHAVSYLNQSTLIDLMHRQVLAVDKLLQGTKSFVAFLVHDCFVIDLAEEDKHLLPTIIKTFSATKWGEFPANVKIGKDYGNMKKVKIKV